jgi:copper ion binding protein
MESTIVHQVPGASCAHCRAAIEAAVGPLAGVESVVVDLERKTVTVSGAALVDDEIVAAIADAGYDVS